jgi:hypothetical protein
VTHQLERSDRRKMLDVAFRAGDGILHGADDIQYRRILAECGSDKRARRGTCGAGKTGHGGTRAAASAPQCGQRIR